MGAVQFARVVAEARAISCMEKTPAVHQLVCQGISVGIGLDEDR